MPVLARPEPGKLNNCLKWAVIHSESNKAEAVQVAVEELRRLSAPQRNEIVPILGVAE